MADFLIYHLEVLDGYLLGLGMSRDQWVRSRLALKGTQTVDIFLSYTAFTLMFSKSSLRLGETLQQE